METLTAVSLAHLALIAPLAQLSIGLLPVGWVNQRPGLTARLSLTAATLALTAALLVLVIFPFQGTGSSTLFELGDFAFSLRVDVITVIMLTLVSFVAVVVSLYARNYLDGEADQGRFYKWLSLTLTSIMTLIVSGNLLLFALAWIATSLSLHQLLMFYPNRPAAVLAAHKKFVASRIGDVSLLAAVYLIDRALGTLDFDAIFATLSSFQGELPAELHWAAVLIVTTAALKSAQFPFHGWLIQVMEAPTPVSALLHAGIVNAGAFLVIRMSPVVSHSNVALGLLAVVGLVTLSLAALVMLTQTSIKVSLAWSTTAQMGFMMLECGLGLYSLAMLHLVAHSVYKAHAFLASGSGVDAFRAPSVHPPEVERPAWQKTLAFMIAGTMTFLIGGLFAVDLQHQAALLVAGAIIAIALTQFLLHAMTTQTSGLFLLRSFGISLLICASYFALHHGFEVALLGSVVPVQHPGSAFEIGLLVAVVLAFAALLLIQQAYRSGHWRWLDALYVHLYNGFYIDVYLTRILQRVWPVATSNKVYGGR